MPHTVSATKEHRREKRTSIVCAIYVHGITAEGQCIKARTITDNISQGGIFLQMPYILKPGSIVFTFTQLISGARLAARGKVVRVQVSKNGLSGLAICFNQLRLIPAL